MKVYISGAITGRNIKKATTHFCRMEKSLSRNHKVVNPLKLKHKKKSTWNEYMRVDLKALLGCDAIYMLNGWMLSRGSRIEYILAKELGLKIYYECQSA